MLHATIHLDPAYQLADVPRELFGSFIEHLGRAVYDGIYCPGHPTADGQGFRRDVLEAIQALQVPLIRYPGGNFASGYRWEDGVGPKEKRPVRPDGAWRSRESNQVGLNEFAGFCRSADAELMMTVNLGTRGVQEACDLLEYCNLPDGTYFSDMRVAHGVKEPHGIKYWCLGNEMDGPWQTGHKTAEEYGRLAAETARAMRKLDPSIRLTAAGSSNPYMPTFPQWEATVLEHTYDDVDFLSLHQYLGNSTGDMGDFLAQSLTTDRFITDAVAACDFVQAKKRSKKRMMLSFDEWNVWYKTMDQEQHIQPWQFAPPLLEERYTMADAAVFGTMLITLLNHADRVKMACQAQLVNVIAPIMTEPNGGPVWRQSIFWPFRQASLDNRWPAWHIVLRHDDRAYIPRYDSKNYTDVPYLEYAAVLHLDPDMGGDAVTIFAVNRSLDEPMLLDCDLTAFGGGKDAEHLALYGPAEAVNGPGQEVLKPRAMAGAEVKDGHLQAQLPPLSWNMLRVGVERKLF